MRSTALTSAFALASVTLVAFGCTADAPTEAPSAGVDPVANQAAAAATPQLLASGLQGASGSAIGPGQALFVTEGAAGRISRVDPRTGQVTTFANGLPPAIIPIGGAIDVAFIGGTAYALVTLVGPEFGGSDVVGIYRVDGPDQFTVIADIGAFNLANPPTIEFDFFLPTGLQYAIEPYRGGFLVSDGHLNRVLHVTLDGEIQVFRAFGNTVPTGLAVHGNTIYMAEAGAVPHLPENGRVVAFTPQSTSATVVATGAPLAVDVGFGRGRTLFALAQGTWDGAFEGSPALPNTGSLMRVNADGSMTSIADGLNLPTSFQVIGNTAYVVTLTGEVWTIGNLAGPPLGVGR
jgi:sugar lactone lactonase YvrE